MKAVFLGPFALLVSFNVSAEQRCLKEGVTPARLEWLAGHYQDVLRMIQAEYDTVLKAPGGNTAAENNEIVWAALQKMEASNAEAYTDYLHAFMSLTSPCPVSAQNPAPSCKLSNGATVPVGSSVPSGDSCNSCTCMGDLGVACTAMACR